MTCQLKANGPQEEVEDKVVTKAGDLCADEHTRRLVVKAKKASRK